MDAPPGPTPPRQQPGVRLALGLGITLALALLALGLGGRALDALFGDMCGSTEITRLTAPDRRHDAVLFEHNCGATTDFATHVSIVPAGAPLGNAPGNVFAAGSGDGARADWGGPPVTLHWEPDGALTMTYDAGAEVFAMAEAVDGVTIRTRQGPDGLALPPPAS